MGFFSSEFFCPNNTSQNIIFFLSRKVRIFCPEFNIRLWQKLWIRYFFFPPPYQNIFSEKTLLGPWLDNNILSYLIHWRVQGIPHANWHTFMVWIKERLPNNIIKRYMYVNVNEWMLLKASFNFNRCHQIIYTRKVFIMSFEIVSGSWSQSD
jgi:hypothetical protein